MLRALLTIVVVVVGLAGCGAGPSADQARDAGPSCVAVDSDAFCSARLPCCAGGWCDSITGYCRDANQCGVSGQGCGDADAPACCAGLVCSVGQCRSPQSGPGGTSAGGATATSTTGGCQPAAASCSVNGDCCSGFCADGNHLCGNAPSTTGGTTSGGGTTGGGTCSNAGVSCSSGTECCSHVCNGVCG